MSVLVINERANIEPFVRELEGHLDGESWEVIFVDDASTDGTTDAIQALARKRENIRLIERVGRHGLASASIEGMCSSLAPATLVWRRK